MDQWEHKDQKEILELPVLMVPMVLMEQLEHKGQKEILELPVLLELLAPLPPLRCRCSPQGVRCPGGTAPFEPAWAIR